MDLSFANGTPQQQNWVREALTHCSFPVDSLAVSVTVSWGDFPPDVDTRHPYMVTTPESASSYKITIAPWADNPGNPNNKGLPDPAGDIKSFYMECFIHEIGHVLVESAFDALDAGTDPRVAQCCGLFWQAQIDSGSGRRYGGQPDWAATNKDWPAMIKEAVAEVFKCAFYTGRHVFMNRTKWNIDEVDWATFLALIAPGGISFDTRTYQGNFDTLEWLQDTSAVTFEPDGTIALRNTASVNTGTDSAAMTIVPSGLFVPSGVGTETVVKIDGTAPPGEILTDQGFNVEAGLYFPAPNQALFVGYGENPVFGPPFDYQPRTCSGPFPPGSSETCAIGDPLPYPSLPFWHRLVVMGNGQAIGEIWATDPALGGTPLQSNALDASALASGRAQPLLRLYVGFGLTLTVGPWTCFKRGSVGAPFPFAKPGGELLPGPAAQGTLLIGTAR